MSLVLLQLLELVPQLQVLDCIIQLPLLFIQLQLLNFTLQLFVTTNSCR